MIHLLLPTRRLFFSQYLALLIKLKMFSFSSLKKRFQISFIILLGSSPWIWVILKVHTLLGFYSLWLNNSSHEFTIIFIQFLLQMLEITIISSSLCIWYFLLNVTFCIIPVKNVGSKKRLFVCTVNSTNKTCLMIYTWRGISVLDTEATLTRVYELRWLNLNDFVLNWTI